MSDFRIFVVEDDSWYAELLKYHLSLNPDYEVEVFNTGKECLNNLHKKPAVITVDYSLPDMNGKELLGRIRQQLPGVAIVIISGQEDITTAVELLKEGAFDYIVKNEDTKSRLRHTVQRIRENYDLREENERLLKEVVRKYDFSKIFIGTEKANKETFSLMERAASSQITVSVTGETGTGKELVAKAIHFHSVRSKKPFIAVNVGAIPKDLIESELFGYEKGAFTGAVARKTGVFEDAHQGTLFLDEVAEMDLNMQTKLLRVLQEREVRRLGSTQLVKVDVRLITATHKNLAEEVSKGNFRADLFYRLMGLPIHLIPLRERGNDIILLARHFVKSFCKEQGRNVLNLSDEAVQKLLKYKFPGNVRELKATIELAVILADGDSIQASHLNFIPVETMEEDYQENMTLEDHIERIVRNSLMKHNNNPTEVSRILGISRATVYRYIKKFEF